MQHNAFSVVTAVTEIGAPIDRAWRVLTDFESYPAWNPFIRRVEGELRIGSRLLLVLQPADRSTTMRPRVTKYENGRSFGWLGHAAIPGLLDGVHTFTLDASLLGCTITQQERVSGVLVPLFRRTLTVEAPSAFERMNDELAALASS